MEDSGEIRRRHGRQTDTRKLSGSSIRDKKRQKRPCGERARTASIYGEILVHRELGKNTIGKKLPMDTVKQRELRTGNSQ